MLYSAMRRESVENTTDKLVEMGLCARKLVSGADIVQHVIIPDEYIKANEVRPERVELAISANRLAPFACLSVGIPFLARPEDQQLVLLNEALGLISGYPTHSLMIDDSSTKLLYDKSPNSLLSSLSEKTVGEAIKLISEISKP